MSQANPTAATGAGRRSPEPPAGPVAAAPQAIADPGPLGLAAFALTTFMLSCIKAGILDAELEAVVLPVALFYGGIAQLLAGMWEFRTGNVFGALAFSSYGAFWLSWAGYIKFFAAGLPDDTRHQAGGLFLLAWTLFTLYMTVGALKVSGALFGVFVVLLLTFVCLTIGDFADVTPADNTWTRVGGSLGLVTAFAAWYVSAAGVLKATWKRPVLPTWPAKV